MRTENTSQSNSLFISDWNTAGAAADLHFFLPVEASAAAASAASALSCSSRCSRKSLYSSADRLRTRGKETGLSPDVVVQFLHYFRLKVGDSQSRPETQRFWLQHTQEVLTWKGEDSGEENVIIHERGVDIWLWRHEKKTHHWKWWKVKWFKIKVWWVHSLVCGRVHLSWSVKLFFV